MSEDIVTVMYMKEKVLSSKGWREIRGLYWNWKKGTRTLREAYDLVITEEVVKNYSKNI